MKVLLILTVGIVCFFSQSSFPQTQPIPLQGPYETSIAWSPDSLRIAIGTDQGIFFVNAANGKITDRFTQEEFGDDSPQFVLQIDWNPDGAKLAIVGKPEITVHYPTDIWIIDLNDRLARKVTNSTLYSRIAEDEETITVSSIYYNHVKWTPDGRTLLLFVETVDRIISNTNDGSVNSQYINTICTLDPVTEEINDFQRLLPITMTQSLPDCANSIKEFPLEEHILSPDCQKVVLKIPYPGNTYGFTLKILQPN